MVELRSDRLEEVVVVAAAVVGNPPLATTEEEESLVHHRVWPSRLESARYVPWGKCLVPDDVD